MSKDNVRHNQAGIVRRLDRLFSFGPGRIGLSHGLRGKTARRTSQLSPRCVTVVNLCRIIRGACILSWLLNTVRLAAFFRSLKHPASMAALILCFIAVLGVFWADGISWPDRLRGLTPIEKLLGIPILIYYFSQS